jgi:hypothetical protein
MEPLDLRKAPPRAGRAELDGIVFLPRTIDKARAALPGGHLNEYTIEGLSTMQLQTFGISAEQLLDAVRDAQSDEDVAAWIMTRVSPEQIEEWNAFVLARKPGGGNPEVQKQLYPWAPERPDLSLSLDFLEEDDRRHFAAVSN